ncbi:hypothetical protein ABIF64_008107 [Bradyrhizobium japonicum]|nr:hypothetical protein [Bradyrhizobium japonicum]MCP1786192.1 hypothetical protein [Bradyrhizobium japonicum]MCP1808071.1 hypothetical protein [Bradyrhizobium japonicum]MCP1816998.1 hypothetical protein [Bradyrhizobium japonicum]MCP1871490.1 hypothetical protein [Bradyrhizobium japonicum]
MIVDDNWSLFAWVGICTLGIAVTAGAQTLASLQPSIRLS